MHWLKDGDMNTHFFHASATVRRKRNRVEKLLDNNGVAVTDKEGLCQIVRDYFVELFRARRGVYEPIVGLVRKCVSQEDNNRLIEPFNMEEFTRAIHDMEPTKAQAPTGTVQDFIKSFGILMVKRFLTLAVIG